MRLPSLKIKELNLTESVHWDKKAGRMVSTYGTCWPGKATIHLEQDQPAHEYLDTIIHEMLHLAFPKLSEDRVKRLASWMAWGIWKSTFRNRL